MVASRDGLATAAGVEVLRKGGNAIDAAVTTAFVLAVTTPQAGNLGGGGFIVLHRADAGLTTTIDFREKAPAAATPDLFLDENGEVDTRLSRESHLASGVPGSVAGLALALEKYGTISLAEAIAPALELAENGFPVSRDLAFSLEEAVEQLRRHGAAGETFFHEDASPLRAGEMVRLPELAKVLRAIAEEGPEVFYRGWIAERFVEDMAANEGIVTLEDLAAYKAVERPPVRGNYRGYEIVAMPPPSSGGVHLVQMFNVLSELDPSEFPALSAADFHLRAEVMKFAYADRSKHLGDSDFYPVPLDWLTSLEYAAEIRARIEPDRAIPSAEIAPGTVSHEGMDTTHFSVIDKDGNAVACTTTVNSSFGNKYLVPGLGFFLNNEMDDFSSKPGAPNAYGLVGTESNKIEAEKRMLSSMSPTLVFKDGKVFLAVGSPGGSRIISSTFQVIRNVIDYRMNLATAIAEPRIHHQWLPDILYYEDGLSPDTLARLAEMGYVLEKRRRIGNVNAVMCSAGVFEGYADQRALSGSAQGY